MLKRVFKFILSTIKPYRSYVGSIALMTCLIALAETVKPFFIKQLIDIVSGKDQGSLWGILGIYAFLQVVLVTSWGFHDYYVTKYVTKYRLDVIEHFMRRMYDYPYSFFQNHLVGSLTAKIGDAFQHVPYLVLTLINPLMRVALTTCIALWLLYSVAPVFALSMAAWTLVFCMITFFSVHKSMALNRAYAEEKSKMIGLAADYLGNMTTVKLFTRKRYELNRFFQFKSNLINIAHNQGFYFVKFYTLQGLLCSIYSLGLIFFLIQGYYKGGVMPGDFALVMMTNVKVVSELFDQAHILIDFISNWGAVDQAVTLLEEKITPLDKPSAPALNCRGGQIVFDNVTFHYKDAPPLFQNQSLKIEAGQKVGLVGYSGGGKSTFVSLILRFYDVTGGAIFVDGQDIRDVTQDSLRANIAFIPQDPSLFHRSILENIRYGRAEATDQEVREAAKKARAHEFILSLPQGYDSLVGERGVKLSGGQRQRIAIARAILKGAPILVLDEATSQLDSVTEGEIQEALGELMQDRTTIVIAHRLSTLLHMDRIFVFNKGVVVEDGAHSELLAKNGLYKTLWDAQVGGFLGDEKEE